MSSSARRTIEDFIDLERARILFEIKSGFTPIGAYPIAQSSRGDVYVASLRGCRVAVKVMRGSPGEALKRKKRLIRELFVWSRLKHENVAPLYGLIYNPAYAVPGIVSMFIIHSLMKYADDHPEAKGRLIHEIAAGSVYLHSQLVIHGDLKPDNIRVSPDGQVKIIDFGMGKLENVQGFTSVWTPNPRHFAPELLSAEDGIRPTFKTDVYSFAMTMLQVLHGTDRETRPDFDASVPFNEYTNDSAGTIVRLCAAVQRGCRPCQQRYRNITQEQWTFLERCWHQDPKQRPRMSQIIMQLSNQ